MIGYYSFAQVKLLYSYCTSQDSASLPVIDSFVSPRSEGSKENHKTTDPPVVAWDTSLRGTIKAGFSSTSKEREEPEIIQ